MKIKKELQAKERGITLIALVITIIILLILAGITIGLVTGDNGILAQATRAKEETENAQRNEESVLENYEQYIEGSTNGGTLITVTGNETTNTKVRDSLGNIIIIPAGFKVVNPGDNVEDGIIIEDVSHEATKGSQFVWIPVRSEDKYVRNTTYEDQNISTTAYADTGYLPEGIQPETDDSVSNEKVERETVVNAGGFYISRYEAGKEGEGILVSKKGAMVWTNISQADCKTTAKTFINNENVKSALCSGIQWDITMDFVNRKQDGNNNIFDVITGNSNRHTGSKATSGQNENDKVCNIYDLEGNCWEYVAEMNSYDRNALFISRGGAYDKRSGFLSSE